MKINKPTGNPIANTPGLDKAGQTKAPQQQQATPKKPAPDTTFEQKQGAADKPGVDFTQTGGKDPFKSGPLIAVNPMPEPTPSVEPSVNPLPEPEPEIAINPLPEPEPEIAINPLPEPEPVVEPSVNPLPEPEPTVEPAINPLPDNQD